MDVFNGLAFPNKMMPHLYFSKTQRFALATKFFTHFTNFER
jgi:hypothetical protein